MTPQRHHHHRHHKSSGSGNRGFSARRLEQFAVRYGLPIAGILLVIGGLIYLITASGGGDAISGIFNFIMKAGSEKPRPLVQAEQTSIFSYILLFLPALLPFLLVFIIPDTKKVIRVSLVMLGTMWFMAIQLKVLLITSGSTGVIYPSMFVALCFFCISQILSTAFSIFVKSPVAFIGSILLFFVSALLTGLNYWHYSVIFSLILLYQVVVFIFSLRFNWKSPVVLFLFFSALYITQFVIRKIFLPTNSHPIIYMFPSLLAWLTISIAGLGMTSLNSVQRSKSFVWNLQSVLVLVFVIALNLLFIKNFGLHLRYPLMLTGVVTILTAFAIVPQTRELLKNHTSFFYVVSILAGLILPQFFPSWGLLLLPASLSLALLYNFILTKSRYSLYLSFSLTIIFCCLYILQLIATILPALKVQRSTGEILDPGFMGVSLLLAALYFGYARLFTYIRKKYSYMHLHVTSYKSFPSILSILLFYISGFLFIDYLLTSLVSGYRFNMIEFAVYSYAFLLILFVTTIKGSLKSRGYRLVLSLAAIVFYLVLVNFDVIRFRNLYLRSESSALFPFILHYLALIFLVPVIWQANLCTRKLYRKSDSIRHLRQFGIVTLLTILMLFEYDHLSLIISGPSSNMSISEMIASNKLLPFSLILFGLYTTLLIYSYYYKQRFLRRFTLIILFFILLKILAVDLPRQTGNTNVILLISLGLILLATSFVIRSIRNRVAVEKVEEVVEAPEEVKGEK